MPSHTPQFACALALAAGSSVTVAAERWCPPEPDDPTQSGEIDAAVVTAAPRIEVCFVLDTTGSMSGLIEGAKLKIWSIANEIIAADPTPEVRIGLIGYRDRGDEYVTRATALTDDIDAIYADLQSFRAGGGGDRPESVNQALHEAVTTMPWSDSRDVLKLIFLVGDAPPQMNYEDDVKYAEVCRLAMSRDLIINTVQCGEAADTQQIWQEIASLAEGSFVAIEQSGNMTAISTPFDDELTTLNVAVGETIVPFGSRAQRDEVVTKQRRAEGAPPAASADRLAYNTAAGRVVQGGGDLIDALARHEVKLEDLKDDELPEILRGQPVAAQRAYLEQVAKERAEIQKRMSSLLRQRQAFIDSARRRLAEAGGGDSFDARVAEMIRAQGARKGIHFVDRLTPSE